MKYLKALLFVIYCFIICCSKRCRCTLHHSGCKGSNFYRNNQRKACLCQQLFRIFSATAPPFGVAQLFALAVPERRDCCVVVPLGGVIVCC